MDPILNIKLTLTNPPSAEQIESVNETINECSPDQLNELYSLAKSFLQLLPVLSVRKLESSFSDLIRMDEIFLGQESDVRFAAICNKAISDQPRLSWARAYDHKGTPDIKTSALAIIAKAISSHETQLIQKFQGVFDADIEALPAQLSILNAELIEEIDADIPAKENAIEIEGDTPITGHDLEVSSLVYRFIDQIHISPKRWQETLSKYPETLSQIQSASNGIALLPQLYQKIISNPENLNLTLDQWRSVLIKCPDTLSNILVGANNCPDTLFNILVEANSSRPLFSYLSIHFVTILLAVSDSDLKSIITSAPETLPNFMAAVLSHLKMPTSVKKVRNIRNSRDFRPRYPLPMRPFVGTMGHVDHGKTVFTAHLELGSKEITLHSHNDASGSQTPPVTETQVHGSNAHGYPLVEPTDAQIRRTRLNRWATLGSKNTSVGCTLKYLAPDSHTERSQSLLGAEITQSSNTPEPSAFLSALNALVEEHSGSSATPSHRPLVSPSPLSGLISITSLNEEIPVLRDSAPRPRTLRRPTLFLHTETIDNQPIEQPKTPSMRWPPLTDLLIHFFKRLITCFGSTGISDTEWKTIICAHPSIISTFLRIVDNITESNRRVEPAASEAEATDTLIDHIDMESLIKLAPNLTALNANDWDAIIASHDNALYDICRAAQIGYSDALLSLSQHIDQAATLIKARFHTHSISGADFKPLPRKIASVITGIKVKSFQNVQDTLAYLSIIQTLTNDLCMDLGMAPIELQNFWHYSWVNNPKILLLLADKPKVLRQLQSKCPCINVLLASWNKALPALSHIRDFHTNLMDGFLQPGEAPTHDRGEAHESIAQTPVSGSEDRSRLQKYETLFRHLQEVYRVKEEIVALFPNLYTTEILDTILDDYLKALLQNYCNRLAFSKDMEEKIASYLSEQNWSAQSFTDSLIYLGFLSVSDGSASIKSRCLSAENSALPNLFTSSHSPGTPPRPEDSGSALSNEQPSNTLANSSDEQLDQINISPGH